MNIIKPTYKILTPISDGGIDELKHLERIGRVCYKSEDKITEDGESAKKFIRGIIASGHEAIIEHGSLSVLLTCDRAIANEIVRHREASYAQESTRYCCYSKDKFGNEISVVTIGGGLYRDSQTKKLSEDKLAEIIFEWSDAMKHAEEHYMELIRLGATPQIARSVLPCSTKTDLTITANYREWRHIFKLRTAHDAHPQIRELLVPLCRELQEKIPVIFDDIELPEE